jgi:heme exporter protein B
MSPGFSSQLRTLIGQGFRAEWREKERLVSPLLFAAVIQLLFAFAVGSVDGELSRKIFLAQTFLTVFLALQVSFVRVFEPDTQDKVFDLIRTYPVSFDAWYLAKTFLVICFGALILIPTIVLGAIFQSQTGAQLLSLPLAAIASLTLFGLAPLGVLLSALTMRAAARQILFPLIYFPLTTPVLLAAVNASDLYLAGGVLSESVRGWLIILIAFDTIYFTLGYLLFREVVDAR